MATRLTVAGGQLDDPANWDLVPSSAPILRVYPNGTNLSVEIDDDYDGVFHNGDEITIAGTSVYNGTFHITDDPSTGAGVVLIKVDCLLVDAEENTGTISVDVASVPAAGDDVNIQHEMILDSDFVCNTAWFHNGGLLYCYTNGMSFTATNGVVFGAGASPEGILAYVTVDYGVKARIVGNIRFDSPDPGSGLGAFYIGQSAGPNELIVEGNITTTCSGGTGQFAYIDAESRFIVKGDCLAASNNSQSVYMENGAIFIVTGDLRIFDMSSGFQAYSKIIVGGTLTFNLVTGNTVPTTTIAKHLVVDGGYQLVPTDPLFVLGSLTLLNGATINSRVTCVRTGVDTTGVSGTIVEVSPLVAAANVLDTDSYGTYHTVTADQVEKDVTFGPDSSLTGTLDITADNPKPSPIIFQPG